MQNKLSTCIYYIVLILQFHNMCNFSIFKDHISCQYDMVKSQCGEESSQLMLKYVLKMGSRVMAYFDCTLGQFYRSTLKLWFHVEMKKTP